MNPERWRYGAENSVATTGKEGHCGAQRRITKQSCEIHQFDHEGLLMVSRALIVSPRRWRDFAWNCVTRQGIAMRSTKAGF